jgi:hypothetical protein
VGTEALPVEPVQIEAGAVMFAVGFEVTVTVWLPDTLHPFVVTALTEYVVVELGLTVIDCVVAPVDHAYDANPPAALSTTGVAAHVDVGPVIVTAAGSTLTPTGADVALQPFASVIVTSKVADEVTVID